MRRTVVIFLSMRSISAGGGAARGLKVPVSVEEFMPPGVGD
jgi:hypothetical protein